MKSSKKTITLSHINVFTLVLLVSYASVGAVAISAALPTIAKELMVSKVTAQLAISLYMIGFAIGPLIFAPLSNQFGRKPLILISLSISGLCALTSLISSHLGSFPTMLGARIVAALVGSGCLKLAWDIAGDLLHGKRLTRMSGFFVLSFSLAPPTSIAVGGYLTEWFGWQSIFLFLIAYTLLLILFSLKLPETMRIREKYALSLKEIALKYHEAFRNGILVLSSIVIGCVTSAVYIFGTEAPFIAEKRIMLSPASFGLFALLTNAGMFLGGTSGAVLLKWWKSFSIFLLGAAIFLLGSLFLTYLFVQGDLLAWLFFGTLALIFLGTSFIYSTITSLAMSHAKDKSYASSLMNFINLGLTVLVVLGLGDFANRHIVAYPLINTALALLALLLGLVIKRRRNE